MQLFPRNSCKILVSRSGFTRRGGLVRPASKSFRFSHHPLRVPEAWHGDFAACGQRSGLLALNLASIFEKLLDQKTFYFDAVLYEESSNCSRKNNSQKQFASQMWAACPHLGSIFEKLLHRKTFQFACGSILTTNIKTRPIHTIPVRMNRVLLFINRKFAANA